MIVPEGARNIEFLGHTDQGGRGDGVQVMVSGGHAYIGTRVSRGIMVTDVRNPRDPKPVNFVNLHPNSVAMHLQAAETCCCAYRKPISAPCCHSRNITAAPPRWTAAGSASAARTTPPE